MITIGMNYNVILGKEPQFESAFEGVTAALSNAEGHEKSMLYRETKTPNNYLIISHWHDQHAFEEFVASTAFRTVTKWASSEILMGRPTHQIY